MAPVGALHPSPLKAVVLPESLASRPVTIVEPPGTDSAPCVVLLHERYGLVQHTHDLARRLATAGYLVATPDLFAHVADRAALARGAIKVPSDDRAALADLEATVAQLARHPRAEIARLAMIGVCQTARFPLVYDAVHGGLRACALFYGAAQDAQWDVHERFPVGLDERIAHGRAPIFGQFGELDHAISLANVLELRASLERANRSYALTLVAGAPHGWLNDTMPGRYRPEQAAAAWSELLAFLAQHLGAAPPAASAEVSWRFACTKRVEYDFTKNVRLE